MLKKSPPINVCYVLACDTPNEHTAMAYLSVRFFKTVHPDWPVHCLMAPETLRVLSKAKHPLLDAVDAAVEIDVPFSDSLAWRNRWVRTKLRELLPADFLYLDNDTLCVRPMDELANCLGDADWDIGLVRDWHARSSKESRKVLANAHWDEIRDWGWGMHPLGYFNSGVAWVRDTPEVHDLYEAWFKNWSLSSATGTIRDQPAFNQALAESNCRIKVLDYRFNGMLQKGPEWARRAYIIHYFKSMSANAGSTIIDTLLAKVLRGETLDPSEVKTILEDPDRWFAPGSDTVSFSLRSLARTIKGRLFG